MINRNVIRKKIHPIKLIREDIEKNEYDISYTDKYLIEIMNTFKEKNNLEECHIDIESSIYDSWGDKTAHLDIYLWGKRPKTEEEIEAEIDALEAQAIANKEHDKQIKEELAAKEKAEYDRLKKKFEKDA